MAPITLALWQIGPIKQQQVFTVVNFPSCHEYLKTAGYHTKLSFAR